MTPDRCYTRARRGPVPGRAEHASEFLTWIHVTFEVSWTELKLFRPRWHPLPAGTTVVESGWPTGQPARAGWPEAPAGWRIIASDQAAGWVVWRRG